MLTIKLFQDADTGNGVDFEAGYDAFFDNFEPYAFPLFLPEDAEETTQVAHLETPEEGKESEARAVLVEGRNFDYTFSNHSVSGRIETVRLTRLDDAYDTDRGELNYDSDGRVSTATEIITISGLSIDNAAGVRGEVHEIIRGFMGGGHDGTEISPDDFTKHVWAEGHRLIGSAGADSYGGTRYDDIVKGRGGADDLAGGKGKDEVHGGNGADTLSGGNGADLLKGGKGADTLKGGKGNDTLAGGKGMDLLTGGKGADTFDFNTVSEIAKDRISDFKGRDTIDLSGIDAVRGTPGNQDFTLIDTKFTGTAGELRLVEAGANTVVMGDVTGDGKANFRLTVLDTLAVDAGDFLL